MTSGFSNKELLYPLTKGGDGSGAQPGHPFEGNQWTGGQGSSLTHSGHRPLHEIATEIRKDWSKQGKGIYFGAKPYLDAMSRLHDIKDNYYDDSAKSVVNYFLANSATWKGDTARSIKAELKGIVKNG